MSVGIGYCIVGWVVVSCYRLFINRLTDWFIDLLLDMCVFWVGGVE